MSSTARSHQQGLPTPLYDLISTTDTGLPHLDDEGVTLPISQMLVSRLLPGLPALRAGDLGIAMCFLPLDISLRAYAIDAIKGVVAEQGYELLSRRDVPVRPEVPGKAALTRPHVVQFFLARPDGVNADAFEQELVVLQAGIEQEMVALGMTGDDVQVISCSARTLTYGRIAGQEDLAALYPDLAGLPGAPLNGQREYESLRGTKPA